MLVLLMSDTHIPRRARDLPEPLWREVERADAVVHAGDWCDAESLDRLQARARRLIAVYGNNDGPELRERLPEVARATLGGVRLAVVHETGPTRNREKRCERRFGGTDVLVFGHSHIPWDTRTPSGLRLLNPGSPTDRRRQPHHTYMTLEAAEGEVRDVRLHELP
jgi:putative phosphoesterase